jgi:hypothetical protein
VDLSAPASSPFRPVSRTRFGDLVLAMFLCAQVLDGVFTYFGIASFGWTEGNPLIAWYMHHFGVAPIVAAAKLMAIGCAVVLHVLGFHLPWSFVLFVLH